MHAQRAARKGTTMNVKHALLAVVLFCAAPAYADSVFMVTGSTTIIGNNVCGGTCTETIDFKFRVTYTDLGSYPFAGDPHLYQATVLPGYKLTSTGPLVPFTTFAAPAQETDYSFGMWNAKGDEIDLFANQLVAFPELYAGVSLYACGERQSSPTCVADFTNAPFCLTDSCIGWVGPSGGSTLTYTVKGAKKKGQLLSWTLKSDPVSTPEPSSLALLLGGLGLAAKLRRKRPYGK
jgi:PEP-CTERM motif